jgi:CDP-diacylglycerol--glycerol-3-phosphate 3-phosphatidyltransferase
VNLPNALTVGRIAVTPLIATLPFAHSWRLRLVAFVLFVIAAVTDYVDGMLARSRKEETDLGRLLDPLADKLLLAGTFVPMYLLADNYPFITPIGNIGLPWWIVAIVIGREVYMTVFRQLAARRGVVIAAIGPAKWKTALQLIWQGSAYAWFFAATLAEGRGWTGAPSLGSGPTVAHPTPGWHAFALFNGTVGALTMAAAVILTVYSLAVYMRGFSGVTTGAAARQTR